MKWRLFCIEHLDARSYEAALTKAGFNALVSMQRHGVHRAAAEEQIVISEGSQASAPADLLMSRTGYFDTDESDVKPESRPALREIATLLKQNAALEVIVVGHTDNKGTIEYNLDLSHRRAEAVVWACHRFRHRRQAARRARRRLSRADRLQHVGRPAGQEPASSTDAAIDRQRDRRPVNLVRRVASTAGSPEVLVS